MDSIFSVDDEIDFSDDELQFNIDKDFSNSARKISDKQTPLKTSAVRETSAEQTCLKTFHKTSTNNMPPLSSTILTDSYSKTKEKVLHCSDDAILNDFINDDTDDLLSQITLPVDEDFSTHNSTHGSKSKSEKNNHIPEKQDEKDHQYYSASGNSMMKIVPPSSVSTSNEDAVIGFTEIQQRKSFNNFEKSSHKKLFSAGKLQQPFAKENIDLNIQPHHPQNYNEVVTPIKQTNFQGRLNKRKSHMNENLLVKPPSRQRRFPGPAGSLPTLSNFSELEKLKSPEPCKRKLTPLTPKTPLDTLSNSQDDDFNNTIWTEIKRQVDNLFPEIDVEAIFSILQRATKNQLNNGKVALLCGLIKSFSISGSGGKLVLKDPSGEINGTVHKNVLDEFEQDLRQGTGLILKDISVFSPSLKKHYVNITPSNIVNIFPVEFTEISYQSQSSQSEDINRKNENIVSTSTQKEYAELNKRNENFIRESTIHGISLHHSTLKHSKDMLRNEDIDHFFEEEFNPL